MPGHRETIGTLTMTFCTVKAQDKSGFTDITVYLESKSHLKKGTQY
jgi:hypothetical protein